MSFLKKRFGGGGLAAEEAVRGGRGAELESLTDDLHSEKVCLTINFMFYRALNHILFYPKAKRV